MDHNIQKNGVAWENVSSLFYDTQDNEFGLFTYSNPYGTIVSDNSVGSNTFSGVYIDGVFTQTGQGSLVEINYNKGHLYFSADQGSNVLSGDYAIPEYRVEITDKPDEEILFESKYFLRPKTYQVLKGLDTDAIPYPVIYIKPMGTQNEPFAFGGQDNTIMTVRAVILDESMWNLSNVTAFLVDKKDEAIHVFQEDELPYNSLGGVINGNYNYDMAVSGKASDELMYVKDVGSHLLNVNKEEFGGDLQETFNNTPIYNAVVDFEIHKVRTT